MCCAGVCSVEGTLSRRLLDVAGLFVVAEGTLVISDAVLWCGAVWCGVVWCDECT